MRETPLREGAMSSLISIDDAVECAGRANYGKEWIVSLTDSEKRQIKEHNERGANAELKNEPSSIIPGMITYTGTDGGRKGFWPSSEEKLTLGALNKLKVFKEQRKQIIRWMKEHGFDCNAKSLPEETFFAELKKSLPLTQELHAYLQFARAREAWTSDRPHGEQDEAILAPDVIPATTLPAFVPDPAKAPVAVGTRDRRAHKQEAVMDALKGLYSRYYSGLTASVVSGPVNKWLKENRPGVMVSEDTIRIALKKLADETNNS
jgi:hypothetical protein